MRAVKVDPGNRLVTVEAGATWADVDRATQAHGLATPGGTVSSVGVAGLTLGGGEGWLSRTHGLTVDNLRGADVVTAEGDRVRASADENTDLFWAIRGGGGNFGVVTSFEYALHEVGPELLAGQVLYPAAGAGELLQFYRDFFQDAPTRSCATPS
jgi:FAD/FMN-containing dehydrogenase